jgi:hypothetical protein
VLVSITPKLFLKCCYSNAENGIQDDILWDSSEQSGEAESSSENESVTEGSMDKFSD